MKEKIAKYALFVRGFVKMSTMIILLILLATYYFYQDKFRQISGDFIETNKNRGVLVFVEDAWNKMKGVQKLQDDRNQNAQDLTSVTKTIKEKTGSYSFAVPESWKVESEQGISGNQLSKTVVVSKTFSERDVDGAIYYENGPKLAIQVLRGEQPDAKSQDGGHGKALLGKMDDEIIGGESFSYHKISSPKVKGGDIIDAHVLHGGNTYEISYFYNKERFNGGEYLFQEIMRSFKFAEKE